MRLTLRPPPQRPPGRHRMAHGLMALTFLLTGLSASGQGMSPLPPETLPPAVHAALAQARLPADSLSAAVIDTPPGGTVWLSHRADAPVNPASTIKILTTFAALDTLGPAHVWRTAVWADGPIRDGVLYGNLYLRGEGDPKLVTEKLWLLMRRLQGLGIERIAGDLVLDRSAFAVPETDPAAFDGEPLRPYNAGPDALLVNFKSQLFTFVPDAAAGVARVRAEPPLQGVAAPTQVPLAPGRCNDWRTNLGADWSDPTQPRFTGRYPLDCGERTWPVAHPEPTAFAGRALAGMWTALGGRLDGTLRDAAVPAQAQVLLTQESPPLAEIVRDVNKFSNNVMAQHVFLALGRPADGYGPTSFESAHAALQRWWQQRIGPGVAMPQVDNGAGLSRETRTTATAMARLLQVAWASPMMPELVSSFPATGLDGTLRRAPMAAGLAHLKTGSLRDVQALAGYVHGADGRRRVLVAIVNHPNARAARPALDALVAWAAGG